MVCSSVFCSLLGFICPPSVNATSEPVAEGSPHKLLYMDQVLPSSFIAVSLPPCVSRSARS